MTDQEINIRRQINKMGYKLKYANNIYFIKGYPNGLSFCNLDKVQEWIYQKNKEKEEKRSKFEELLHLTEEKMIFPTYNEEYKNEVFKCIKHYGINNESKKMLDKIFDENSELYDEFITYDIENILSNINRDRYYSSQNLDSMVYSDMESCYFLEITRLNPDVDPEIICSLQSYDFCDFYDRILEHISIDELKKYIMKLADHD